MATKLTKPVRRLVLDNHGNPLTVTLTAEGVLFRRPRCRTAYLLPYISGEARAQVLASGDLASHMLRRRKVTRGLLTT